MRRPSPAEVICNVERCNVTLPPEALGDSPRILHEHAADINAVDGQRVCRGAHRESLTAAFGSSVVARRVPILATMVSMSFVPQTCALRRSMYTVSPPLPLRADVDGPIPLMSVPGPSGMIASS